MNLGFGKWYVHDGGKISPTREGKTERKSYLFYSFNKASLACCISTSLWGKPLVVIILLGSLDIHVTTKGKKFTQMGGALTVSLSIKEEIIEKNVGFSRHQD